MEIVNGFLIRRFLYSREMEDHIDAGFKTDAVDKWGFWLLGSGKYMDYFGEVLVDD